MIGYIICEGNEDKQLLKTILPSSVLTDVEIVVGNGISSIKSLARSLVAIRQKPIAIFADADSTIPELVQMRIREITEIVESVSVNTPVKVILCVPEMESVFFQDVQVLASLLGYMPSQDSLDLAVAQPRKILEQLITKSKKVRDRSQIVNKLADENVDSLRDLPAINELIVFLKSIREVLIA